MARIRVFFKSPSASRRKHGSVECGWSVFEADGTKLLQLDTYGSVDRKRQGAVSQSIQLDQEAAFDLVSILNEAFPGLIDRAEGEAS